MKSINWSIYVALLVCGILFLNSCEKQEPLQNDFQEETFNVEQLQSNLLADQDFITLEKNRNAFFNALRNKRHNILEVRDIIGYFDGTDFCSMKDTYEGPSKSTVRFFSSFVCQDRQLLLNVVEKFPNYLKLSAEQLAELNIPSSTAANRKDDCLAQFQKAWRWADRTCPNQEEDDHEYHCYGGQHDQAIENYDNCCAKGGSGCP